MAGITKITKNSIQGIDTSADATAITIDSSENVGIGTSSPSAKLHVEGNSGVIIDTSTVYTPVIKASGALSDLKLSSVGNGAYLYLDAPGTVGAITMSVNGSERMRIDNSGKVSVGDAIPFDGGNMNGVQLHSGPPIQCSRDNTAARAQIEFKNPNGSVGTITTNGSSTAYNTSSDYRLKENVVDITGATERLKQLQPKRFNFIANADTTVDGFLAHEVSSVVPEAITGTHNEVEVWEESEELPEGVSVGDNKLDDEGNTIPKYQGIDQSKLVPLLTASLKEAIAKIEELETRLTALENI